MKRNKIMSLCLIVCASLFAAALGFAPASSHALPSPIPILYSAKAITGKVVDAETNAPIEGVVIVAQWRINERFVGYDNALIKVMETVSDSEGNYSFPGWGPVWLPPMWDFSQGHDPLVSYFKAGYWPEYESNDVADIIPRFLPFGEFEGDGKTVDLRRWDGGDIEKYQTNIHILADVMPAEGAGWRSYPRMTLEIDNVGRLVQQQTRSIIGQARVEGFRRSMLSGSDEELIRSIGGER